MKNFLLIILSGLIIFSLTACNLAKSSATTYVNTISAVQLTDREKMLLSIDNEAYYVFDYNIDEKYNWMDIRVDKYEFGKKVSDLGVLSSGFFPTNTGMIAVMVTEPEKNTLNWMLFANGGKTKLIDKLNFENDVPLIKFQEMNDAKKLLIYDKEITLAYVGYKDGNKNTTCLPLSDLFSSSPEENIKKIETYDVVYLLQCKFYKKST